MFSRPLIIFGTLVWITSNIFTSFLKCTAQNWTPAEALTLLNRAEGLFHMPCPVYTSHCDVSLSTTSEHFWLVFNLWFIQPLKWDSKKQLPSWGFWWLFFPNLYLCGWFFSYTRYYWISSSLFFRPFLQFAKIILISLPTLLASNQL